MATSFKVGNAMVCQFLDSSGHRWTVRPGTGDKKQGDQFARRIEALQGAKATGARLDAELAAWVHGLSATVRATLAAAGLLSAKGAAVTLGEWCQRFVSQQTHWKPATRVKAETAIERLKATLGADRPRDRINPTDVSEWAAGLAKLPGRDGKPMAEATRRIYCRVVKALFAEAVRQQIIDESPAGHLKVGRVRVAKNWHYLSLEDFEQKLLPKCIGSWRTMFALCRLAGLRRGEALRLTWRDVDFDAKRLTILPEGEVETTKQRRRTVPVVPRLYELLMEAFEAAPAGQERVLDLDVANLDQAARRRIRWAGFPVWSKPFHALRKNCQTDWSHVFPADAVADWLGNSVAVAFESYLQTPAELYDKAISGAAESAAFCAAAKRGEEARDNADPAQDAENAGATLQPVAQASFSALKCRRLDSNQRPRAYESLALTS